METSKTFLFTIENIRDSGNLMKDISKFLRDVGVLKFGSVGKLCINLEYQCYEDDR